MILYRPNVGHAGSQSQRLEMATKWTSWELPGGVFKNYCSCSSPVCQAKNASYDAEAPSVGTDWVMWQLFQKHEVSYHHWLLLGPQS